MTQSDKPSKPNAPPAGSPKPSSKVSPETRARVAKVLEQERKDFVARLNAHALQNDPTKPS